MLGAAHVEAGPHAMQAVPDADHTVQATGPMNVFRPIVTPPWRRALLLIVLLVVWLVLVTTSKPRRAAAPGLWIPVNVPSWKVG
jgi:hypothetical protein